MTEVEILNQHRKWYRQAQEAAVPKRHMTTCFKVTGEGPCDCGGNWHDGEASAPLMPSQAPADYVWVLQRGDEPIRWYANEARAKQDLALVESAESATWHYTLHAVPRVE